MSTTILVLSITSLNLKDLSSQIYFKPFIVKALPFSRNVEFALSKLYI